MVVLVTEDVDREDQDTINLREDHGTSDLVVCVCVCACVCDLIAMCVMRRWKRETVVNNIN